MIGHHIGISPGAIFGLTVILSDAFCTVLSYGSILDEDNERARRSQSRERSRRGWKALWAKTSFEILRDFAYKSDY